MIRRLAYIFFLSGLLLVAIYFVSPSLGDGELYFCAGGMGLILVSFLLNRMFVRKSSSPRRFRTLRRILGKNPPEEEDE